MKKAKSLLSLILALALVTASLPMMFITAIAYGTGDTPAIPTTVYVDTTNTNETPDGTEGNPFTTIAAAVAALNGADGTVVLKNTYTGDDYDETAAAAVAKWDVTEAHAGTVTFKGAIDFNGSTLTIAGPTVFEDVTFVSNAQWSPSLYIPSYDVTIKGATKVVTLDVVEDDPDAQVEKVHDMWIRMRTRADGEATDGSEDTRIEDTVTVTLSGTGLETVHYAFARMEKNSEAFKNHNILIVDANIGNVTLGVANNTDSANYTYMPMASIVLNSGSVTSIKSSNSNLRGLSYSTIDDLNLIANNGTTLVDRARGSDYGATVADYTYTPRAWNGNLMTVARQYKINATAEEGSYLLPTDTAGQFQVVGDKVAVATNSTGTVRSENGILTLTQNYSFTDSTHTYDTWNVTWEDAPTSTFNVGVSSTTTTVENTDNVAVNLNVSSNNADITNYASGDITVKFDPAYLTYVNVSDDTLTVDESDIANGNLRIGFHGADRSVEAALATINFTAKALTNGTPTKVEVTAAGISTAENATVSDLEESYIVDGTVEITINEQTFTVSDPSGNFNMDPANGTVEKGSSVTLTPINPSYTYAITANGEEVTANTDGSFTIANLQEDVTIEVVSKTAKTFNVTTSADGLVSGTDYKDIAGTATYLVDYTFKVKADKAADQTAGWTYTVTVTDGLTLTKGAEADGFVTYTVTGSTITKDFTITITKKDLGANQFAVNIDNNAVDADNNVVDLNDSVTLTLTQKPGYTYTVKYTMGDGEEVDITTDILAGAVTIENVTGVINVTVTETMNRQLSASVYVEAKGIWLVLNTAPKMDGNNTYSYNGVNMYWSSKYNAYAVVVFEEPTDEALEVATLTVVTVIEGTVIDIAYDKDVNCTGVNDINDAQLVYNIYNGNYTTTTENVTVRKLLEADLDGSKTVNTLDAAAVVDSLFETNNG